jgi:hypothetical protein
MALISSVALVAAMTVNVATPRQCAIGRCSVPVMQQPNPGPVVQPSSAAQWRHYDPASVKARILQISALTDRGQRLNRLIAPTYQELRPAMDSLVCQLAATECDITEEALEGEWELIFSDVELFRSSPFFLAIEEALNASPGIPALGRALGLRDPTRKAELFFKCAHVAPSADATT